MTIHERLQEQATAYANEAFDRDLLHKRATRQSAVDAMVNAWHAGYVARDEEANR